MKAAWFTDTWLPAMDGVVSSLLSFKEEIEKRGHKIYLFVPGENNIDDFDEGIFYYKASPFKKYPNYRMASIFSIFCPRTKKIIRKIRPDIIHSHSPGVIGVHGVAASYKYGIPLIFTYHTFLEDSVYFASPSPLIQDIAGRLLRAWLKWYFRRCNAIIAPSNAAKIEIGRLAEKIIEVVPTGINVDRFSYGKGMVARKEMGLGNEKVVLHVGRIVKEKNLDLLVDAAPLLLNDVPDAIFIIVGEGPYAESLKHKVKEMKLNKKFIFTGFIEDEKLPDYYKCADIFAFPSKYETQGIVAIEAMAAGLPVVAARIRSLPEIIEDGKCGFLFNPDDAHDFAEKMTMSLRAKEMPEKAKKFAMEYSIEKCTDKLLSLYERFK